LFNVPVHRTEKYVRNLSLKNILRLFVPLYVVSAILLYLSWGDLLFLKTILPIFFGIIGLMMVVRALNERKRAETSWILIVMNHFWVLLAVLYNESLDFGQVVWYLSGIVVATIGGYLCLRAMKKVEMNINLDRFRGHSYEHPVLAFLFLLCCLALAGFPISPTFVGEDLLFSHIHSHQFVLAGLVSLSFVLNGIAIIRIFALIFLGPHAKTYHELAYKSS
jgi:NADH-quinone oxidoreductase subunit L